MRSGLSLAFVLFILVGIAPFTARAACVWEGTPTQVACDGRTYCNARIVCENGSRTVFCRADSCGSVEACEDDVNPDTIDCYEKTVGLIRPPVSTVTTPSESRPTRGSLPVAESPASPAAPPPAAQLPPPISEVPAPPQPSQPERPLSCQWPQSPGRATVLCNNLRFCYGPAHCTHSSGAVGEQNLFCLQTECGSAERCLNDTHPQTLACYRRLLGISNAGRPSPPPPPTIRTQGVSQ